jgi:hypothetical protein
MNELQIALAGAGVVGVLLVWGYNRWQERAHRKLAEKIFRGEQPDVLLDAAGGSEPASAEPGDAREPIPERQEPVMAAVARSPQGMDEPVALTPLPEEWADEIADCIVRIDFIEPVAAPALWSAQSQWVERVGKSLSWLGFDEATGLWRRLTAHDARRYSVICAACQLADRSGPVTDGELSAFLDGTGHLARQLGGVADLPSRDELLMHARALDDFCAGVDLQLGVNIVGVDAGSFAGTKVRGVAEAAGLRLLDDGRFHSLDESGATLFTLANISGEPLDADAMRSMSLHGVTLSLDVPRVAHGEAAFDRMLAVARQLMLGLGGALVDGQRKPLSVQMIAEIRAKIGEIQDQMAVRKIPAGGSRALRLFS